MDILWISLTQWQIHALTNLPLFPLRLLPCLYASLKFQLGHLGNDVSSPSGSARSLAAEWLRITLQLPRQTCTSSLELNRNLTHKNLQIQTWGTCSPPLRLCQCPHLIKPPLAIQASGFTHWCWPPARPFFCHQNTYIETRLSQKLRNLEVMFLLATYRKSYMAFSRNPLLHSKNWR